VDRGDAIRNNTTDEIFNNGKLDEFHGYYPVRRILHKTP